MTYTVAFVGTGADPEDASAEGFAMAYAHAEAYEAVEAHDCELLACADVVPENAAAFATEHGIPEDNVFEDGAEMCREVEPDVVSVCVPPAVHADVVVDCARTGAVEAIHCEKPMADTWGAARRMTEECWRRDVQLTFNHQRRFAAPWRRAKELLDAGEIGDLQRVETFAPNLYDWGTHCLDLCGMYADEASPEWVIGQIDYREKNVWFGQHNENQALVQWTYENGVDGLAATGRRGFVGAFHRLVGDEGELQVRVHDGPDLRVRRHGDAGWEVVDVDEEAFGGSIHRAIADVVASLDAGEEPELSARNALNATEIIFAGWESARRRGRVDLPLEVADNPLEDLVARGELAVDAGDAADDGAE